MKEQNKINQVRRNRLLLASIIIILIATLTPGKDIAKVEIHNLDKIVHFSIFFFLSVNICYKYVNHKRLTEILVWSILFGLLTEVAQQYVPGRDMSLFDGIADCLGIIIGYYAYKNFQSFFDKLLTIFWA